MQCRGRQAPRSARRFQRAGVHDGYHADYPTGYVYGDPNSLGNYAGPHAVSAVTIGGEQYTLTYDENGAVVSYEGASGAGKAVQWNSLQQAVAITATNSNGVTTATDRFAYGRDGQRYYRQAQWVTVNGDDLLISLYTVLVGDSSVKLGLVFTQYMKFEYGASTSKIGIFYLW